MKRVAVRDGKAVALPQRGIFDFFVVVGKHHGNRVKNRTGFGDISVGIFRDVVTVQVENRPLCRFRRVVFFRFNIGGDGLGHSADNHVQAELFVYRFEQVSERLF